MRNTREYFFNLHQNLMRLSLLGKVTKAERFFLDITLVRSIAFRAGEFDYFGLWQSTDISLVMECIGMSKGNAVRLIRNLEKKGLIIIKKGSNLNSINFCLNPKEFDPENYKTEVIEQAYTCTPKKHVYLAVDNTGKTNAS